jgi:hypothetical protein
VEGHGHVGEEVAAGVGAVGADAADLGGEVDDDVGGFMKEGGPIEAGDLGLIGEIPVLAAGDVEVVGLDAASEEFGDVAAAEKPASK